MKLAPYIVGVLALIILLIFSGAFYTVHETEIVILTQFGRKVGEPVTEPGLHWKTPFVQKANRLDKRVLEFDGQSVRMTTKNKTYIEVDTFARWRISDADAFYVTLKDERSARSRLEDIIGSELRTSVAAHELIEVVRSDKDRELPKELNEEATVKQELPKIKRGRTVIQQDILAAAAPKLESLGIELLDVRIKRVNYGRDVQSGIYQRMISEREQIAQRFRSEGEGESLRIRGRKERELQEIKSTAYKRVQELRGEADAEATRIYAEAYDKSPEARDFYVFLKTLDTYRSVLGKHTSMILSTDSELFRLLETTSR